MAFSRAHHFLFASVFFIFCLTLIAIRAEASEQNPALTNVSTSVVHPVQHVITEQLEAIRKRDADAAFAFTTDNFHSKYSDARDFLGKIRFEFRPIYNHRKYSFLDSHSTGESLIQKVEINEPFSEKVLVVYKLKPSGETWLIDSFSVITTDGPAI